MNQRALLSVSDKTGLTALARGLAALGWELVASGGTAGHLHQAGVPVTDVAELTGTPEMLAGRVKTLHPAIHGGILARDTEADRADLAAHGIQAIDLVVSNLYPFQATVARPDVTLEQAIEQIDIGGVALLRAAAKNFARVTVLTDPNDYPAVLAELKGSGQTAAETRRRLAVKALAQTAAYDGAIVNWLNRDESLPETLHLNLERAQTLRYGENPHQPGARYRWAGSRRGWDEVVQHGGIPLGYLNVLDAEAAWSLVHALGDQPAAVIVKHANPCGVARAATIGLAYERAFAADAQSAFGGVVAVNRPVDRELAEAILARPKADVLIAPDYAPGTPDLLTRRRKNTRLLAAPPPAPALGPAGLGYVPVNGGFLVQQPDPIRLNRAACRVVTVAQPGQAQWPDIELAWLVCAHTRSNAIVLAYEGVAWGIGAGQQSRVDAGELAARKAAGRAAGGVCASDAFYPFRDGIDAAAAAGVSVVIQPGGSIRDAETIAAADELGLAMIFTGERHFRH